MVRRHKPSAPVLILGSMMISFLTLFFWMSIVQNVGLAGIIMFPITFVVGLILGLAIERIFDNPNLSTSSRKRRIIFILLLQALVLLYFLPHEGGPAYLRVLRELNPF